MNRSCSAFLVAFFVLIAFGQAPVFPQLSNYTTYGGIVVDGRNAQPLSGVSIKLVGTQLGTVTNDEGAFIIKVPDGQGIDSLECILLGYSSRTIMLATLVDKGAQIALIPEVTTLDEVNIPTYKDAQAVVRKMLDKRNEYYLNEPVLMTTFYRETIRRRRRNVSLTEAVIDLYKRPYTNQKNDMLAVRKARKRTDYRRLDTVALKLQGGPFSTVYMDMPKYPEYIFSEGLLPDYIFELGKNTTSKDGRVVLVVNFKPKPEVMLPRYYGRLLIDAETLALYGAEYRLNLEVDNQSASRMFVRKKPRDIEVTPIEASYKVDYRREKGKWHYNYSQLELSFKVDKRGRLFNTVYTLASEMAVTDLETISRERTPRVGLKPSTILSDEVAGFADPDFWGPYNVIEPEKSIEAAIRKIQRKLDRNQS
jgi:hypothetical protein